MKLTNAKIADLGKVVTGKTPSTKDKENFNGNIPFITPVDMTYNRNIFSTERCVSIKGAELVKGCILPPQTVCVSCIGSDMGKSVITTETSVTNQQINSIIVSPKYNFQYVYYLMRTLEATIKSLGKNGTAVPILSKSKFSDIEICVHDYESQCRIAQILSAYDDLIENNQKQIKLLEEAAQRLYKEWFVDLRFPGYEDVKVVDGVPEGWKRERLVDIADVQYGYAFDGSLFNSEGNGMPIIRIRNIPDGITKDYTTEEADEQYIVKNGDIVVGMDGEFHINSWSGEDSYLVQRTCRIKPHNADMSGYLIQAIYEPIKFFESTVVGATVAHLGKKHIDTITILTAPEEMYEPFQRYFNKRQLLLNQNQLLAEARDRLLPKLMSGEVEVIG